MNNDAYSYMSIAMTFSILFIIYYVIIKVSDIKRKSKWLKHAITAMIVSALLISFMLLCAACYWRGFVDGRRVYHNKDIACIAYKGKFNCKIMEGLTCNDNKRKL